MEVGFLRVQLHAMQGMGDDNGPGVVYEHVLTVDLLQLDTEIRIAPHGRIHGPTKDVRVYQVTHPNPDPDVMGVFPAG
jgi:hypothetical protein